MELGDYGLLLIIKKLYTKEKLSIRLQRGLSYCRQIDISKVDDRFKGYTHATIVHILAVVVGNDGVAPASHKETLLRPDASVVDDDGTGQLVI